MYNETWNIHYEKSQEKQKLNIYFSNIITNQPIKVSFKLFTGCFVVLHFGVLCFLTAYLSVTLKKKMLRGILTPLHILARIYNY